MPLHCSFKLDLHELLSKDGERIKNMNLTPNHKSFENKGQMRSD